MPERKLNQIMAATDAADVATLAMIEAVRQLADNGKATNRILEGMQVELRDVRERVIRIEAAEYKGSIEKMDDRCCTLEERIDKLEASEHRRQGALGLVEWMGRNWPALIGFVGLIVLLVMTGRIKL